MDFNYEEVEWTDLWDMRDKTEQQETKQMTIAKLVALLMDLPIDALNKPIYVSAERSDDGEFTIEPVTESCDNPKVIGYIIVAPSKQLEFDFSKDVNQ